MLPLRTCSSLTAALVLAVIVRGEDNPKPPDKPATPWVVDRALTVTPQLAAKPVLTYRLLPPDWELRDGNAVPIYLRLLHEQGDASQKYLFETPAKWNELPLDRLPIEEVRKYFERWQYTADQIGFGARRRSADWNYTIHETDAIGILLPDAQMMRRFAHVVILQARVALAQGDFKMAIHHLATGFASSRHVGQGPFLITSLVGIANSSLFARTVADLIERPDAPNLYWALNDLPRPLIDLQPAEHVEYRILEMLFPELEDLDRERTEAQWDKLLKRIRTRMRDLAISGATAKLPDWYPTHYAADEPAAKSPDLPAARQFVARSRHLTAQQVEAMPAAQVVLIYLLHCEHEFRDDTFVAFRLPFPQARAHLDAVNQRLRLPIQTEGHLVAHVLLPALGKMLSAQARIERHLAALRIIEALRLHAAAHDGKLPEKLTDVTAVPIPEDPGTGKPFAYVLEGATATLTSQIPNDPIPVNGIRYRVTIR